MLALALYWQTDSKQAALQKNDQLSAKMKKYTSQHRTDAICRSLLQKAVRRADVDVTKSAVIKLIEDNDLPWLRNRLGVITFEECWPEIININFNLDAQTIISQYIRLANSTKNKNAAGLGSLAYELSLGDTSVLIVNDKVNRDLKIISEAINRPDDFWKWIKSLALSETQKRIVSHSEVGFRFAGWPWDKSFAISTAYLSAFSASPQTVLVSARESRTFPYWIAIDKHTPEGKQALARCAEKFKLDRTFIGWIQFYLESAKCINLEESYWWQREKNWRLAKYGVDSEQAEKLWINIADYLKEILSHAESSLIERLKKAEHAYNREINEQRKLI